MCVHYPIAGTHEEVLCNVMKISPDMLKKAHLSQQHELIEAYFKVTCLKLHIPHITLNSGQNM